MNTLGERIKYLREQTNVRQLDLSKQTGISRSNISKIESDTLSPTANSIVQIARFFNVSTDWLLTGNEFLTGDNFVSESSVLSGEQVSSSSEDLTAREAYILKMFRRLDETNQIKLEGRLENMTEELERSELKNKKTMSSVYSSGEEAATIEAQKYA